MVPLIVEANVLAVHAFIAEDISALGSQISKVVIKLLELPHQSVLVVFGIIKGLGKADDIIK